MPNRRVVAKELAEFLRLLSHTDRILIVQLLAARGEHSVASIAESLDLPPTRVSQHLSVLRGGRLVEERAAGRLRIYALASPQIAQWLLGGVDFVAGRPWQRPMRPPATTCCCRPPGAPPRRC